MKSNWIPIQDDHESAVGDYGFDDVVRWDRLPLKFVRKRLQDKLWKAVRRSEHSNPRLARTVRRAAGTGLPVDRALSSVVADCRYKLNLRCLAARMLKDVAGDGAAFVPLLTERVSAGEAKAIELHHVIRSIRLRNEWLTLSEFETLYAILRTGSPEQRYFIVDQIAFFKGRQVRRTLIEVLEDPNVPDYVRAWAAERLNMHLSRETVAACIRALENRDAEVRLWAVSTLGSAAEDRPSCRVQVLPILERMLADDAVVPGWWAVRREAQGWLASLRRVPEEQARMQENVQAILLDPLASKEEKKWAARNNWYGYT